MTRFFPLPEYDLSDKHVEVTITGKVIDKAFADALMKNRDMIFYDVVLLDKIQKKNHVTDEEANYLRSKGFIEGRKPNYHITSELAGSTDDSVLKARAIKQKGFADDYYTDLIIRYLEEYECADKHDICELLFDKLPDSLNDEQKYNKVTNIIKIMKRRGSIINTGTTRKPEYRISK